MKRYLIAFLILTGCTAPQQITTVESPCDDARYAELQEVAVDDMSEREYEYFRQKESECADFRRAQLQNEPIEQVNETTNKAIGLYLALGLISTAITAYFLAGM